MAIKVPKEGEKPSGAAVAIVVDGKLRHAGGIGTRGQLGHPLADAPVDADTLFWTASTSKWVHGVMVMSMVEEGLLDLAAPVTNVLPDYRETMRQQDGLALYHLLAMTSGLKGEQGEFKCTLWSVSPEAAPNGCAALSEGPGTVLERLFAPETLASSPYDEFNRWYADPGVVWDYSNWDIMLSGRMAEIAGEAPYPDLVARRVFGPVGMCSATYDPQVMLDSANYAVGSATSTFTDECPEPELGHDSRAPWDPDELACRARDPNGGIRASVVDLGRFAEALLADLRGEHVVLSSLAANHMLCPGGGLPGDDCRGRQATGGYADSDTYGYTNFHQIVRGYHVYKHGGSRPGYGSLLWMVPEHNFAVVMLANVASADDQMGEWAEKTLACWLDGECSSATW